MRYGPNCVPASNAHQWRAGLTRLRADPGFCRWNPVLADAQLRGADLTPRRRGLFAFLPGGVIKNFDLPPAFGVHVRNECFSMILQGPAK